MLLFSVPLHDQTKCRTCIYTNGTMKLRDYEIAADIQECLKIQIKASAH